MTADVEITELEKIEADRVDGVGTPANGIPFLLMKSLAKAPMDADGHTEGPTHGAFDGTHTHSHAFGDDTHSHSHSHDGDGDHGHSHAGKAAGDGQVNCPTCKGDGKILGNNRDCPDCGGDGKVTPAKAKQLAAKALAPARTLVAMALAAPDVPAAALFKAIAADGSVDEQPDIDGGKQAIALIAKLIGYEADELAAGCINEVYDIQLLSEAVCAIKCWLGNEQAVQNGDTGPAALEASLMQSAAKAAESTKTQNDLPDSAFAYIEPGGKKDEEGKTTPRSLRHFPVHDKAHASNALARLSSSPFGDKAKAKVHAAAKKFGIDVSDTSKSQIAEEGADVDTVTKGTGDLAEVVEAAVTKAVQPHMERIKTLEDELAKVKATPVPGGPMMSVAPRSRAADGEDWAAKAQRARDIAESLSMDPNAASGYRQLARQYDDKAKQTA